MEVVDLFFDGVGEYCGFDEKYLMMCLGGKLEVV